MVDGIRINLEDFRFFIKRGYIDMRSSPRLALIVQNEKELLPFEKSTLLYLWQKSKNTAGNSMECWLILANY